MDELWLVFRDEGISLHSLLCAHSHANAHPLRIRRRTHARTHAYAWTRLARGAEPTDWSLAGALHCGTLHSHASVRQPATAAWPRAAKA